MLPKGHRTDFNPRSLAGATHFMTRTFGLTLIFQSTLPCGSDTKATTTFATTATISIHAPLRERHQSNYYIRYYCYYFNPRSLTGATYCLLCDTARQLYFNPRSLAGATLALPSRLYLPVHFNPRSLAGATISHSSANVWSASISIHAPLRERPFWLALCKN